MNGSHNEFVQLSKNKPTREHNVTLHHPLPTTLRYIKERRKTMKSETASSHRATSNPQSTIHFSFHFRFITENHRQPHGQKKAAPLPTAPRRTSHYKTVRKSFEHSKILPNVAKYPSILILFRLPKRSMHYAFLSIIKLLQIRLRS